MPQLLTIKQLSEKLSVSTRTIHRWIADKKIPVAVMPGGSLRFDEKKIDNWIEANTIKAKSIGTV